MSSLYDALASGLPPEELARTTRLVVENERAQVEAVRAGTAGPGPRTVPSRSSRHRPPSAYEPLLMPPPADRR